jgi:accessory colonization factor AcfC
MKFVRPAVLAILATLASGVRAEEVFHVYGPGGPLPAMKEAAETFSKASGARLEVVAGPTDKWIVQARADADVIFSGSEYMMTDLVKAMEGRIDEPSITSLYLRPSAILVRPGNPKAIRDLPDLARPGTRVLVVQGSGQTGMWEDMAGKQGDIGLVRALRRNIVTHAPNSAAAKQAWTETPEIDAWIIYNIWQVANPKLADLVTVGKDHTVYRSCGVALTRKGKEGPIPARFAAFLQSSEGAAIFKKWGWMAP